MSRPIETVICCERVHLQTWTMHVHLLYGFDWCVPWTYHAYKWMKVIKSKIPMLHSTICKHTEQVESNQIMTLSISHLGGMWIELWASLILWGSCIGPTWRHPCDVGWAGRNYLHVGWRQVAVRRWKCMARAVNEACTMGACWWGWQLVITLFFMGQFRRFSCWHGFDKSSLVTSLAHLTNMFMIFSLPGYLAVQGHCNVALCIAPCFVLHWD